MDFLAKSDAHRRVLYSPLKLKGFVPPEGSEVIVKQVPPEASEYDLLIFCQKIGPVYQVRLMVQSNGQTRGFAFVTFINKDSASKAVQTLGLIPFSTNHYVKVEISMNNCRIFLGGIPLNKSKEEVWKELTKCGAKSVVDVIMFKSYTEKAVNRGFVFVEFWNHEAAAHFRAKFSKIKLFGQKIIVDWSVPIPPVSDTVMSKVTKLFLRNLDVLQTHEELSTIIRNFVDDSSLVQKIYKFKNFAFIHLANRKTAEELLKSLLNYFENTPVEVTWAKPNQKMTSPVYRQQIINRRNAGDGRVNRRRNVSESASYEGLSSSMSSLSPTPQFLLRNAGDGCVSRRRIISESASYEGPSSSLGSFSSTPQLSRSPQQFSVFDSLSLLSSARTDINPFEVPTFTEPLVPFQEIQTRFSDDNILDQINQLAEGPLKRWAIKTLLGE